MCDTHEPPVAEDRFAPLVEPIELSDEFFEMIDEDKEISATLLKKERRSLHLQEDTSVEPKWERQLISDTELAAYGSTTYVTAFI